MKLSKSQVSEIIKIGWKAQMDVLAVPGVKEIIGEENTALVSEGLMSYADLERVLNEFMPD